MNYIRNLKATFCYFTRKETRQPIIHRLGQKISLFSILNKESSESILSPYTIDKELNSKKRYVSILESLGPKFRPSQALNLLQIKGAGQKRIRIAEFQSLCLMSRIGVGKDAKIIIAALKDFKRCNSFYVTEECCKIAYEGMLRSLTPRGSIFSGSEKVYASLWMGDAFLDKKTGLYYATDRTVLEEVVLKTLFDGLVSIEGSLPGTEVMVEDKYYDFLELRKQDEREKEKAIGLEERRKFLMKKAVVTTVSIIDMLLRRVLNPSFNMKKRAAREYKNRIKVRHGPFPSTVHKAVKICLVAEKCEGQDSGGLKAARHIVNSFEAMSFSGGVIWDKTNKLLNRWM